jgi:hypothetical protein
MESAMYALFVKLLEHPELANRYRGHLLCSVLAALGMEDDQAFLPEFSLRAFPQRELNS